MDREIPNDIGRELTVADIRQIRENAERRAKEAQSSTNDDPASPPSDESTIRTKADDQPEQIKEVIENPELSQEEQHALFAERIENMRKQSQIKGFLLDEQYKEKVNKAGRLERKEDKTKEEQEYIIRLREEAEEIRKQREQIRQLNENLTLGQKVINDFMCVKLTELLCLPLVAAGGAEAVRVKTMFPSLMKRYGGYTSVRDKQEEEIRQEIVTGEMRANLITETMQMFMNLNIEAAGQHIVENGKELFAQEDFQRMQELIDIVKDTQNPQQAELYAEKCAEFGLDKEKARQAFLFDKTPMKVPPSIEKELLKKSMETVEHFISR